MITGIGTDMVDVAEARRSLARWGARWERRLFTPAEIEYCRAAADPAQCFAARIAAKEAVFKALGAPGGAFLPKQIEVTSGPGGAPALELHGAVRAAAAGRRALISLTHTPALAAAAAVVEVENPADGAKMENAGRKRP